MKSYSLLVALLTFATAASAADPLERGVAVSLDRAVHANERGVMCLVATKDGVFGGTTGRAAHLFRYDPAGQNVRSLHRFDGGIGFAHQLVALPDGSLVAGTQVDPTGIATQTDADAVGKLYRLIPDGDSVKVMDLGRPVEGQGIYSLAHDDTTGTLVGLTWPDGHLFSLNLKNGNHRDHGAIAGFRTFETPRHANDLNRGSGESIRYTRQVSRAIAMHKSMAYTGGVDGYIHRFDCRTGKIEKLKLRLPAVRGRESWASIDAAIVVGDKIIGGTSDGYLFEIRPDAASPLIRSFGKPLAQGCIQGLVAINDTIHGIGGETTGVPRSFTLKLDPFSLEPGMLVHVAGGACWDGFGALVALPDGTILGGERDRIARLIHFGGQALVKSPRPKRKPPKEIAADITNLPPLDFRVVFAPAGTTTDGSGYTAIEVGKDDRVYVGAARYGGYASLLRFDPKDKPIFMDKVVDLGTLSGEDRSGINTQGKIHAKILVGADGRVWFATKQAHEIFDTRPEYGEDRDGFPGGHLCYFDPKTNVSKSLGIPMKQDGLMGGAIDDARQRLYYRSEPKNHFLVYDLKTGRVRDRGNVGAMGRYMARDKNGAVYTVGRDRILCRYDPTTDYVEDLQIEIEGEGGYVVPYVILTGPNGKLYGLATNHNAIMEFAIDKIRPGDKSVTMRNVAKAAPQGLAVEDIHAGVFGKDGKLYYPLNTTGPGGKGRKTLLIIMRFDPATRQSEAVGIPRVIDFDESKVKSSYVRGDKFGLRYMQGAAVSSDGSLYLMGIYPQLHVACFPKLTAMK